MKDKWQCQFKNPPKKITVGQKLLMLCEGDTTADFNSPLRVEFLDKQTDLLPSYFKNFKTRRGIF